ncbi:MAG: LytR/AlgR family response regulator transcription factor [Verrucomicrobium sp.]|nr:response regulator [Verrucomicrobium sp.]
MRCLIVDDEELARQELRLLLDHQQEVEVVGEARGVADALALTARHQPDVVFLDVQLWGESGFDYLDQLEQNAPQVIFVTAYDQYAVQGFERNAVDYLLKPLHEGRLAEALDRARIRQRMSAILAQQGGLTESVLIRVGSATHRVPWREIQAVLSEGNYSRVCLKDGAESWVLKTLKEWLALSPDGELLQVHRTALVRPSYIRSISTTEGGLRQVVLESGRVVPVGRAYWPQVKSLFRTGGEEEG